MGGGLVGLSLLLVGSDDSCKRLVCPDSEKAMATRSSVLAWRLPGMGEPGGLPSMGSHIVRHD